MVSLVACIGEGQGTLAHVLKLMNEPWDHVYLVMSQNFIDKFKPEKNASIIPIDTGKTVPELVQQLAREFDGKFFGDACVNLISGTGKEHMAIIAALLKSGAGIRLVTLTKEGMKEI